MMDLNLTKLMFIRGYFMYSQHAAFNSSWNGRNGSFNHKHEIVYASTKSVIYAGHVQDDKIIHTLF